MVLFLSLFLFFCLSHLRVSLLHMQNYGEEVLVAAEVRAPLVLVATRAVGKELTPLLRAVAVVAQATVIQPI